MLELISFFEVVVNKVSGFSFRHKYERAPKEGQCPVNALPRELLNCILSCLWIGMRANEVCKGWEEYFVEVLMQDLAVWDILAKALECNDNLPASRSSLVVRKQKLIRHKDLECNKDLLESKVQSSFFENIFALARIIRKPDKFFNNFDEYQDLIFEAVQLNEFDTAIYLIGLQFSKMRLDVAIALGTKWVYAGNGNRALVHANDCNEETKFRIAKAFIQIGHYTQSMKVIELFSENKTKADILLANAEALICLSETEKSYKIALKIQRIIRSNPSAISRNFVKQCNEILKKISMAFSEKGDMNRAHDISQMMLENQKKIYIPPY